MEVTLSSYDSNGIGICSSKSFSHLDYANGIVLLKKDQEKL